VTRYQIDSSWWRRANTDGDTVVAGSPLKIFRFSSAARSVLEAIEKRDEISVAATNTLHRLIDAGAIHPILESIKTSLQPSDVTVVIPVHNEDVLRLNALISKLSAAHEVLLIDDGSTIPLADINGARVIRHVTPRLTSLHLRSLFSSMPILRSLMILGPNYWHILKIQVSALSRHESRVNLEQLCCIVTKQVNHLLIWVLSQHVFAKTHGSPTCRQPR